MRKNVIAAGLIVLLVAVGAVIAYRRLWLAPSMCPACDRPIMANMKFTVVEADGKRTDFCCVRCGQHYIRLHPAKIKEALVTAFDTGKQMSMYDAAFVYGSEYAPCCAPPILIGNEKVSFQRTWDRCYPSLIPFSTRAAAGQFARQHGGAVLSYVETQPLEK